MTARAGGGDANRGGGSRSDRGSRHWLWRAQARQWLNQGSVADGRRWQWLRELVTAALVAMGTGVAQGDGSAGFGKPGLG